MVIILGLCILSIVMGIYIIRERAVTGKVQILARKEGVAVVYIYGPLSISRQASGWARFLPGADSVTSDLRKIGKITAIKAVVLRINSPGGSIGAVQEIYEEVNRLKEKGKKIVVSMGDVGASGAYYIACAADKIVANPGTITGSIGVLMSLGNMEELFRKIGIRVEVIKRGKHKDIGSPSREMTPQEKELLQGLIDDAYDQFFQAVIKGRNLKKREAEKIAQGQVFTGRQARDLGLIDEIGNFQDAVRLAGKLAGIPGEPRIIELPKPFPRILGIFSSHFRKTTLQDLVKENSVRLEYILQ
ncbi:signal peptide peptidase SppA [bacterium]|nr:signal peptide peptidase SppA [bacterium]NIN91889.1 signal peptide peptidase SppA [bacterium]NIO18155.1 signal peptide peptidase SppA [bacterium]NIO73130.1 signal peptide peptidase SppA [bacterium]